MEGPRPGEPVYLLVDVDGPLNPYMTRKRPYGYEPYNLNQTRVLLNKQHGEWLNELEEAGFTAVWCTSWEHQANELIAPILGTDPDWDVVEFPHGTTSRFGHIGKYPEVYERFNDSWFAWFDDDFMTKDRYWSEVLHCKSKLIHVSPGTGLMRIHIDTALDWLKRIRGEQ